MEIKQKLILYIEFAGLEYYVEDDYLELGEVIVYIQNKTIQKLQNDLVQERKFDHKQTEAEKQKYSQLKKHNEETERKLKTTKKQVETALRELNNVKTGWSFRTGRVITFIPRKIWGWLK